MAFYQNVMYYIWNSGTKFVQIPDFTTQLAIKKIVGNRIQYDFNIPFLICFTFHKSSLILYFRENTFLCEYLPHTGPNMPKLSEYLWSLATVSRTSKKGNKETFSITINYYLIFEVWDISVIVEKIKDKKMHRGVKKSHLHLVIVFTSLPF